MEREEGSDAVYLRELAEVPRRRVLLPNLLRPECPPVHVVFQVVPNDVRFLPGAVRRHVSRCGRGS